MPGHRRSIRLKNYDYSGIGAYFVTVCTWDRRCLFGEIISGEMQLSQAGETVDKCWKEIPVHFPHVKTDEYTIMPNHIHGILIIETTNAGANEHFRYLNVGAKNFSPPRGTSKTIGSVIRGFKIGVTKWMRQNTEVKNVWQRNYYEHVIRNDEELNEIREYIITNPRKWDMDRENPNVVRLMEIERRRKCKEK